MPRKARNHTYSVPTSNFILDWQEKDIQVLEDKFKLYALEIPKKFNFIKSSIKFPKLHNAYKNQLDFPYYFFSYENPKPTIYVLLEKNNLNTPMLNLGFMDAQIIGQKRKISEFFLPKKMHVIMKLLLSSWFHEKYYTCQSSTFLIHSKNEGKNKVIALSVNIASNDQYDQKSFKINNSATYLLKVSKRYLKEQYLTSKKFYEKLEGEIYYRQVKTDHIREWLNDEENNKIFWQLPTSQDRENLSLKRANIKWFEDYNYDRCKSNLIRLFQNDFLEFCNHIFGNKIARQQTYTMTRVEPIKPAQAIGINKNTGLYLILLNVVGVYDNRLKDTAYTNKISIRKYVDFFNKNYGKKYSIKFEETKKNELLNTKKPVLVLQDYEKLAFEENNLLFGYDDPKDELYRHFATKIALQTLNVNTNTPTECALKKYFNYKFLADEKVFEHKIDVCLNDLLLKYYIVNHIPVFYYDELMRTIALPCIVSKPKLLNYAYMYNGIFMYIDWEKKMQFIDLNHAKGKSERNAYLANQGIDWFKIEKEFASRNYTKCENGNDKFGKYKGESFNKHTKKLKETHFVFKKGVALAIEDTEERVLHKYDPARQGRSQRTNENKTALEGVYYSKKNNAYSVGVKSLNMSLDDSVKIRKIHYYQKNSDFQMDDLLTTLAVQFVRNKQYTVYPYFFDLLNLYREMNKY